MTAAAHGPTRTRRPTGELTLVPDAPRQVKEIWVKVEQLDGGLLRFTMPKAPGWVQAARSPVDVVRVLRAAFAERQVAAYSMWRGTQYDHPATPQHRRSKPRSRGKKRCDVYSADQWLEDVTGMWISPGAGHRHRPDSAVVLRVRAERIRMGLPEFPSLADGQRRQETVPGTQLGIDVEALIPHLQAAR